MAWGLFVLLFVYVALDFVPLASGYQPDDGIVGAVGALLISLLASGRHRREQ
ncbi:hypothetical protein [Halocatena halophila]|uniref:hypothetical protein n=1 Tax=Halocatena halophila TaxID=2814576 RepID=UPI002ECFBB63